MRLLPREHGATVIWLTSFILALATLPRYPMLLGLLLFITVSLSLLVSLGWITSKSSILIRLERNVVFQPMLSGLLTLIVPFGHIVMVGGIGSGVLAVFLLYLTYTMAGVVYTRISLRAILKRRTPKLSTCMVLLILSLIAESAIFYKIGWLNFLALIILIPLFLFWMTVRRSSLFLASRKAQVIKRIGLIQSFNMLLAISFLSIILRV